MELHNEWRLDREKAQKDKDMTTLDIFYSVCIATFFIGILMLCMSYIVFTSVGIIINLNTNMTAQGIQQLPAINTLLANSQQFSLFFPDLALFFVIVLIMETFVLSFFLRAHPLSAILGIFSLFAYTIISFFISNELVTISRLSIFSSIISGANPLLILFINLPVVLVVASIMDIAIALTASHA